MRNSVLPARRFSGAASAARLVQDKKKGARGTLFRTICGALLAVALTELVDLLGGLQDVLLAGVKRMRLAGDFQLQQRILVTVFPLDGFSGGHGRLGQNGEI